MRRLPLLALALSTLAVAMPSTASASHSSDKDCSDFASQAAALDHLKAHPGDPDGLDGDNDGRPCVSLPCPCGATATAPQPPPAPATGTRTLQARVTRVIDGDTLKVRLTTGKTISVRLIGIDTPETKKPGTPVECGGRDATARMKKLAFRDGRGRVVTLRSDPTQDLTDRFGRLLAYVSGGGVDFGRTMISSGGARTYVFEHDFQRVAKYRNAQAAAKAANRGAWSKCGGNFHVNPAPAGARAVLSGC